MIASRRIQSQSQSQSGEDRYTFLLGRIHSKIGGPTRTILGYVSGLRQTGSKCIVAGLGSESDIAESFPEVEASQLLAIDGSVFRRIRRLLSLYLKSDSSSIIVVVGVWHLSFFTVGTFHLLCTSLRISSSRRLVLIPTMSLTEYDWAKHVRLKRVLRPLVGLILRQLDGVIFASSGELRLSGPATWRNSTVILHPTLSIRGGLGPINLERTIDLLFVGRIDPQKDLPLLFETFARLDGRRKLDIIGDGSGAYILELKKHAESLGIAGRINWHGWKTHTETLEFLGRSRAVAVTSLVENYCHVAVEALVSGCELVLVDRVMSAMDFSALADIEVVEPTPDQLAAAIERRLDSWSARHEDRAAGAAAITDTCSAASAADSLRQSLRTEAEPAVRS